MTQQLESPDIYPPMRTDHYTPDWSSLQSASCRNALTHAAKYAGLDLPLDPEPARKPIVETMVLGSEEDRQELLDALKQHHRR